MSKYIGYNAGEVYEGRDFLKVFLLVVPSILTPIWHSLREHFATSKFSMGRELGGVLEKLEFMDRLLVPEAGLEPAQELPPEGF